MQDDAAEGTQAAVSHCISRDDESVLEKIKTREEKVSVYSQ